MNEEKPAGVYLAKFRLQKNKEIQVGSLGPIKFVEGDYVYAGSAQSGLKNRVERHFRENKTLYWHIDYFSKEAQPIKALGFEVPKKFECKVSQQVQGEKIEGFGSSDCDCSSHLTRLQK